MQQAYDDVTQLLNDSSLTDSDRFDFCQPSLQFTNRQSTQAGKRRKREGTTSAILSATCLKHTLSDSVDSSTKHLPTVTQATAWLDGDCSCTLRQYPIQWTHAELIEMLSIGKVLGKCRLRLVMLFALRYERDGRSQISSLIQRCQDCGMDLVQLGAVRTVLLQAGADK